MWKKIDGHARANALFIALQENSLELRKVVDIHAEDHLVDNLPSQKQRYFVRAFAFGQLAEAQFETASGR